MPPAESAGEYLNLVIHVQPGQGGVLIIDGTTGQQRIPQTPATLVIRLWRSFETGIVRGSIGLHSTDIVAPIQSNTQLERLIRTWLNLPAQSDGS